MRHGPVSDGAREHLSQQSTFYKKSLCLLNNHRNCLWSRRFLAVLLFRFRYVNPLDTCSLSVRPLSAIGKVLLAGSGLSLQLLEEIGYPRLAWISCYNGFRPDSYCAPKTPTVIIMPALGLQYKVGYAVPIRKAAGQDQT